MDHHSDQGFGLIPQKEASEDGMMEFSQHHHNLLVHADGGITATAESIK